MIPDHIIPKSYGRSASLCVLASVLGTRYDGLKGLEATLANDGIRAAMKPGWLISSTRNEITKDETAPRASPVGTNSPSIIP